MWPELWSFRSPRHVINSKPRPDAPILTHNQQYTAHETIGSSEDVSNHPRPLATLMDDLYTTETLQITPPHTPLSSTDDSDNLPSYESLHASEGPAAPAYISSENDHFYRQDEDLPGRALVFSMRHHSRRLQSFIDMGPPQTMLRGPAFTEVNSNLIIGHQDEKLPYPWSNTHREFLIEHKFGAGFTKNKPDIHITALDRERARLSPSPPTRRKSLFSGLNKSTSPERNEQRRNSSASASTERMTQALATVRFARDGPLPWTPHARLVYDPSFVRLFTAAGHGLGERGEMEMSLGRTQTHPWKMQMLGQRYSWQIRMRPARLVLIETDNSRARAEFVYSQVGSWAQKGGEVGRMRIPLQAMAESEVEDGERSDREGEVERERRGGLPDGFLEYALCTLTVCVTHWKNECRHLVNVEPLSHWSGLGMGAQQLIPFAS